MSRRYRQSRLVLLGRQGPDALRQGSAATTQVLYRGLVNLMSCIDVYGSWLATMNSRSTWRNVVAPSARHRLIPGFSASRGLDASARRAIVAKRCSLGSASRCPHPASWHNLGLGSCRKRDTRRGTQKSTADIAPGAGRLRRSALSLRWLRRPPSAATRLLLGPPHLSGYPARAP